MVEDTRCRRTVTINLKDGLHLRPVAQIVETVRRFGCSVRISKGDLSADAGNVLDLIPLRAEFGDTLVLEGTGDKAAEGARRAGPPVRNEVRRSRHRRRLTLDTRC